jgi:membrane-associated phospholipid phosphatase
MKEIFQINEINLNYYLQNNHQHFYNKSLFISNLFNTKSLLTILTILYLSKLITINILIQFLISTALLIFIKYLVQRKRPFNLNKNIKNLDNSKLDPFSFPSGHMFTASLLILILQNNIQNKYKYILYIVPFLVGYSRIILGVHHLTDVIASFIIAYILNLYLFRLKIME